MAKKIPTGEIASGAAGAAGNALGRSLYNGQSAIQDATNDVNPDLDIQDEASSKLSNDAGGGVQGATNTGRTAADVGGRLAKNGTKGGAKTGAEAVKGGAKVGTKAASETTKLATQKAANAASNVAQKTTKAAGRGIRKALQAIANTIANAVRSLFTKLLANPYVWIAIIIIIVILLCLMYLGYLDYFHMDNASVSGDKITDSESLSELNKTDVNQNEEMVQIDISSGSKIISAYYTYFSTKSLWVLFEGNIYDCRSESTYQDESIVSDKMPKETVTIDGKDYEVLVPVQYGSSEFIEIYQYDPFTGSGLDIEGQVLLSDKYKRESNFYLAADAIASIDNTLHHGNFRYPEQIVQKVKYKIVIDDESTGKYHYELDDLADENGLLYTKDVYDDDGKLVHFGTLSTKYTQDDTKTEAEWESDNHGGLWIPCIDSNGKVSEKVTGVWDYGFGSILHYMKYIEAHENRGEVVQFQVLNQTNWDTSFDLAPTDATYYTITPKGISNFLTASDGITVPLFKKAVIEYMDYNTWNALDSAAQSKYFTGKNETGDPTHPEFDKNRVYGLPSTTSYMIDWVVTAAGTMNTQIVTQWKDSYVPFSVIENDGTPDYDDEEFNYNADFDNGEDLDIRYYDHLIDVQTVTHMGPVDAAEANFTWYDSYVGSNGTLITNPTTKVYLVRYVKTGDATVDAQYDCVEFTDEYGAKRFALKDSVKEIKMFSKNGDSWKCNKCGMPPAELVYELTDHVDCYDLPQTFEIEMMFEIGPGLQKMSITRTYSGSLSIDSKTGKITSIPKTEYIPEYYDAELDQYVWAAGTLDEEGNPKKGIYLSNDNRLDKDATCRVCNKKFVTSYYRTITHEPCCTVTYEYDIIETTALEVGDNLIAHDASAGKVIPIGYVQLARIIEGTKWDKEPTYSGEPDTSNITGKKYYDDYFTNYSTFVPRSVQGDFNFDKMMAQTGLNYEEMIKLLDRETLVNTLKTIDYEDYFEGGTSNVTINSDGSIDGYIGPCFISVKCEVSKFNPSAVGTYDFPSYGIPQLNQNANNVTSFMAWMLIDPDRSAMWYKVMGEHTPDEIGTLADFNGDKAAWCEYALSTDFTAAWKNAPNVLSVDEYVTWGMYQIAYMYNNHNLWNDAPVAGSLLGQWHSAGIYYEKSRVLQELFFCTANNGATLTTWPRAISMLKAKGIYNPTDEDVVNAVCDAYMTISFSGDAAITATMHERYDKVIRKYFLDMIAAGGNTYPIIGWDESIECFAAETTESSPSGFLEWFGLKGLWKYLTGAKEDSSGNLYYPWNKLFVNSQVKIQEFTTSTGLSIYGTVDANSCLEKQEYSVNAVSANDIDYEIAKIFATVDKVPVSSYLPLTDSFFKLKYHDLFDESLSFRWAKGKRGMSFYLPDGWACIFAKPKDSTNPDETGQKDVKYTLVKEFDKTESPVLKALVVYGGTEVDASGNPVKKPITIHSASKGTVLEIGSNLDYGGRYVLVQYKNCVIYYAGLTVDANIGVGDEVYKYTILGTVLSGDYLSVTMKTSKNGSYLDPTRLLKGGLDEVVEYARTWLGTDYEYGGVGTCQSWKCCKPADHAEYSVTGERSKYAFDCSGFVRYVFVEMGFDVVDNWGCGGLINAGEDVTSDYMVNGVIDWSSVPVGTVVFMDTSAPVNGDSNDHVGIWTGDSLIHSGGGDPWKQEGSSTSTYWEGAAGRYENMVVYRPERNHAKNNCMVKENFIWDIPTDISDKYQETIYGHPVLTVSSWWVNSSDGCVVALRDYSGLATS